MNYRVFYIGLAEGYTIEKTIEPADGSIIYEKWSEAKKEVLNLAKNDLELVRGALRSTRDLRKVMTDKFDLETE